MKKSMDLKPYYKVLSNAGPTPQHEMMNKNLHQWMEEKFPHESNEGLKSRAWILTELEKIFKLWVQEVCVSQGMDEDMAKEAGGKLYTSGSYKIGVNERGADIDTICVAPQNVRRGDFFTSLREKMEKNSRVTNFNAVETARVPIMTFDFDDVNIDLLFAQLNMPKVPDNLDINDDNILEGVDDESEKSLNGPRVTNLIIALVPDHGRFLMTLRFLRMWAKSRGLYSNKLGYLGGVNLAILVGMVCQMYPNACASILILKFFFIYQGWAWPNPVYLCTPKYQDTDENVWNPQNYWQANDLMPIITPAYPSMNSTSSVNEASKEIMMDEFKRGFELSSKIINQGGKGWDELVAPSDFFCKYLHYLCLNIIAENEDDLLMWEGFVASRLRHLTRSLRRWNQFERVHLFCLKMKLDVKDREVTGCGHCYYLGFQPDVTALEGSLELGGSMNEFDSKLNWELRKPSMLFIPQYRKWKELPEHVFESVGGKKGAKAIKKELKKRRRSLMAEMQGTTEGTNKDDVGAGEGEAAAESGAERTGEAKSGVGEAPADQQDQQKDGEGSASSAVHSVENPAKKQRVEEPASK